MTSPTNLDAFPIRATCDDGIVGFMPLAIALRDALGLPANAAPVGGVWVTQSKAGKNLQGGLRVLGTKQRTVRGKSVEVVRVSMVAFNSKGALVGWSRDLDPGEPGNAVEFRFCTPNGASAAITANMKAVLKSLTTKVASAAKAKKPATPLVCAANIVNVAVTPDGQRASTIDKSSSLSTWNLHTGERLGEVRIDADCRTQAIAADGKRLAIGHKKIEVRALGAPDVQATLSGHPKGEIIELAWAPDGKSLASLSAVPVKGADNSVALWDVSTGRELWRTKVARPNNMHFASNGKAIVCGTYEGLVSLSRKTGAVLASSFAGERIEALTELTDGVLVMLGQSLDDGVLVVVNPETHAEVRRLTLPGFECPQAGGEFVIARNEARTGLMRGNARTGRIERSAEVTKDGEMNSFSLSADGSTVVVVVGQRLIVLGPDLKPLRK